MKVTLLLRLLCILPLLVASGRAGAIEVETLLVSTTTWNGAPLPPYPEGQPQISILKITIPPKARLPWHKHPMINSAVLLAGTLRVTAASGQVHHLQAWDAISELVDTWHYGENTGDEPAVILVVYAGAVGMPLSIPREPAPTD
jgi:quercetin dioxygenase-like cupin family protein